MVFPANEFHTYGSDFTFSILALIGSIIALVTALSDYYSSAQKQKTKRGIYDRS